MNCLVRSRGRPGFEEGIVEVAEDRGVVRVRTDAGTIQSRAGSGLAAYVSDLALVTRSGTAIFFEDKPDFDALYDHLLDLGWVRRATHQRLRRVP